MSKANKTLNEFSIGKITLGISIFIFIGTFPFWIIDRDSKFSILNTIYAKMLEENSDISFRTEYENDVQWAKFYINLVLTSIGLIFYYISNFSKYLGYNISRLIFTSFSHDNNKTITWAIKATKAIIFIATLAAIYNFIINLIEGNEIPIVAFNLFLIVFFLILIIWNTGYPDFEELSTTDKLLDYRNTIKLVRLDSNQIAYINKGKSNSWELCLPENDVDMSFSRVCLYEADKFAHNIANVSMLETDCGVIKGNFYMKLFLHEFPKSISSSQRQNLQNIYGSHKIKNLIFDSIDKENLKKKLEKTFIEMNEFNIISSENLELDADSRYRELLTQMSSSEFDKVFTNQIKNAIKDILLNYAAFSIEFAITQNSIKENFDNLSNEYKQLKDKERSKVDARDTDIRKAGFEQENILISALVEKLKSPATPEHVAADLIRLVQQIKTDPTPKIINKGISILNGEAEVIAINTDNESNKAAEEIGLTIHMCKLRNYSKEDMIEKISSSTNYFDIKGINIDAFLGLLFFELETEKEVQSKEEYITITKDLLLKILEKNE